MAYTTPRTWSTGETVTKAMLDEQIRDNIAYLKGVLDGTDSQNVTVHANKTMQHGTLAVMRAANATKRHVESSATDSAGSMTVESDYAVASVAVTFVKAFASVPQVVVNVSTVSAGAVNDAHANAISITTTGFTMKFRTNAVATTAIADWIAVGVD